jgi:hypothetical protein
VRRAQALPVAKPAEPVTPTKTTEPMSEAAESVATERAAEPAEAVPATKWPTPKRLLTVPATQRASRTD